MHQNGIQIDTLLDNLAGDLTEQFGAVIARQARDLTIAKVRIAQLEEAQAAPRPEPADMEATE